MRPPVALLVYASDDPGRSVFYPFANFSPEWLAIRFALERGVKVRFMDLPMSHQLGELEVSSQPEAEVEEALDAIDDPANEDRKSVV